MNRRALHFENGLAKVSTGRRIGAADSECADRNGKIAMQSCLYLEKETFDSQEWACKGFDRGKKEYTAAVGELYSQPLKQTLKANANWLVLLNPLD